LDAFLVSTVAVAVAEIGDKTQLLALLLVARFARPAPILFAIFIATLANHAAAALVGASAVDLIGETALRWGVGLSFFAIAAWILVPDQSDRGIGWCERLGVFGTALVTFFLAEIGDKTQIATIVLAARYDTILWVTAGTTLGMMLANLPVVVIGGMAAGRLPLPAVRVVAAVTFALLGFVALFDPVSGIFAAALAR
jgi:putative Ca2+/H+ antiporter (TMEM165/GDT1 family)